MHKGLLLILTAIGEGGAGILLLADPTLVLHLLFGTQQHVAETLVISRVAGSALVAIGIESWMNQKGDNRGLVIALLAYNIGTTVVLVSVKWEMGQVGMLLWPAVIVHLLLALWCGVCIWNKTQEIHST